MFLVINAICGVRRARKPRPVKFVEIVNIGFQTAIISVSMASVAACSGIPFVPGV